MEVPLTAFCGVRRTVFHALETLHPVVDAKLLTMHTMKASSMRSFPLDRYFFYQGKMLSKLEVVPRPYPHAMKCHTITISLEGAISTTHPFYHPPCC